MDAERDEILLKQALRKGLITRQAFEDLKRLASGRDAALSAARSETWGPLAGLALDRGLLTIDQLNAIAEEEEAAGARAEAPTIELTRANATEKTPAAATDAPTLDLSACEPAPVPGRPPGFAHYRLVKRLGAGGMGEVYEAYDMRLERHVALKYLTNVAPIARARFLQEARAQARIEHPNICRIHESGEINGQPYIAMQLISGRTLKSAAALMTLEEKIRTFHDVADAVHAAHRQGLIHRDIKPSNIMVEQRADGRWIPYVLDFGLAKEQGAPGLTSTGHAVGTPFYMSPEQIGGKRRTLDRRSDIFSLGVTLYELLSDRLPFPGESTGEVLMQVLQEEPAPLRAANPHLPLDLEAITFKCLEKEPQDRYGSARELRDDLARYLNGEPTVARQAGIAERLVKRIRRNKAISLVTGVAALVVLLAAVLMVHVRWTAAREASAATRFGTQVKEVEALMRYAHLVPLHDTTETRDLIKLRLETIERSLPERGRAGKGPGHYALGQGYLLLNEPERALSHLTRAWEGGYRTSDVAYALGLAHSRIYQGALEELRSYRDPAARSKRRKQIDERLKEPALRYLEQSEGAALSTPEYGRALISFLTGDYEKARAEALAAYRKQPWLYEAKVLEAKSWAEDGYRLFEKGDLAQAQSAFDASESAFREALDTGQSDPLAWREFCSLWKWVLYLEVYGRGGQVGAQLEALESACGNAIVANPAEASAHTELSEALRLYSERLADRGQDPLPFLDRSERRAREAISLDPDYSEGYHHLGNALRFKAMRVAGTDMEAAGSLFEEALAASQRAVELNPTDHRAMLDLGNGYSILAEWRRYAGLSAADYLDSAIRAYEQTIELAPWYGSAHMNLSITYLVKAQFAEGEHEDPRPYFSKGIEVMEQALDVNPGAARALANKGMLHYHYAGYEASLGIDPALHLDAATEAARRSRAIDPNTPRSYILEAQVALVGAAFAVSVGKDPEPFLEGLFGLTDQVLERNPNEAEAFRLRGEAGRLRARALRDRGETPRNAFEQGERQYLKALEINPRHEPTRTSMILFYLERGQWSLESGASPRESLERARELATQFIEQGDSKPQPFRFMAEAILLEARWRLKRGLDPGAAFRQAHGHLDKALALDALDLDCLLTAARLARFEAAWRLRKGLACGPGLDAGLAAAAGIVAAAPGIAEGHCVRAGLLSLRAQHGANEADGAAEARAGLLEEAGQEWAQALHLNPKLAERPSERLAVP